MLAVPVKSPIQSAKELVDYAKANPGKLRMSTTAKGAAHWIQVAMFERATGAKFAVIENPGGGSYIALQLAGGHADVGILSFSALFSQYEAGNVRILATTGPGRMRGYEKIQTLKEQGYNYGIHHRGHHPGSQEAAPGDLQKVDLHLLRQSDRFPGMGRLVHEQI